MDSEAGPSSHKRRRLTNDITRGPNDEKDYGIKQENILIVEDHFDPGVVKVEYDSESDKFESAQRWRDRAGNDDGSDSESNGESLHDDESESEDAEEGFASDDDDVAPAHASDDEKAFAAGWNTTGVIKKIKFTKRNEFTGKLGGEDPIDYFNYFFTNEFLTMICAETNAQAQRLLLSGTKEFSRVTEWKNITVPELKIFLGLLFHMGTISIFRVQDYWKKSRLFSIPIFSGQMGRNRFILIMRCLHFTSEPVIQDPLYKVRKLIDYFNSKMAESYYPTKELTVNKSVVSWRGRLTVDVTNIEKSHNYGIQLYALTELDGLVLKFCASTKGKQSEAHTEDMVMQLLEEKRQQGHALYLDSSLGSFRMAKKLLDHGTYCTAMLRKDHRGCPNYLVRKKLKEGENYSMFKEGVHMGKWKDRRGHAIPYITTEFENKMVPPAVKRLTNGIHRPEALVKYTQSVTDAPRLEYLYNYYPLDRKSLRWDLKITIHIFQTLFVNSYFLYNKLYKGQKKLILYEYRLKVIESLLPVSDSESAPCGAQRVTFVTKESVVHEIRKISERTKTGRTKRRLCRYCYQQGRRRSDSPWYCATCADQPALCVRCFTPYHTGSSQAKLI